MEILKLREEKERISEAACWFHEKWKVPMEAYRESMQAATENNSSIPQWYIVVEGNKIIAGAGVIENDFHKRKDLTPNLCALYVEEEYRCQGIAGKLLDYVCNDMKEMGIETLYLITEHTSFYEKYDWRFYVWWRKKMSLTRLGCMYMKKACCERYNKLFSLKLMEI